MKRYIKAGKGTMEQFLDQVYDRIDYLQGENVEESTDIMSEDDPDGDEDDDEADLREQAIEHLVKTTPCDEKQARFLVEWVFDGIDDEDLIDVIDRQAYYIEIYDDNEWQEKFEDLQNDGFTDDEIWGHAYQDAAFDGVIFFSDL